MVSRSLALKCTQILCCTWSCRISKRTWHKYIWEWWHQPGSRYIPFWTYRGHKMATGFWPSHGFQTVPGADVQWIPVASSLKEYHYQWAQIWQQAVGIATVAFVKCPNVSTLGKSLKAFGSNILGALKNTPCFNIFNEDSWQSYVVIENQVNFSKLPDLCSTWGCHFTYKSSTLATLDSYGRCTPHLGPRYPSWYARPFAWKISKLPSLRSTHLICTNSHEISVILNMYIYIHIYILQIYIYIVAAHPCPASGKLTYYHCLLKHTHIYTHPHPYFLSTLINWNPLKILQ